MVVEGEMDNNVTEPVTFWVGFIFSTYLIRS